MTVLIRNCAYIVCKSTRIERDCDLLIEGAHIKAIGKELDAPGSVKMIDGRGCAVIPGLVNAHTHLYQNLLKGISPGLSLVPWCNGVLFPYLEAMQSLEKAQQKRLAYLWTALASIEMVRGGVTSCINMDFTSSEIVHAWKDIGFRGVLAYTLTNKWVPESLRSSEALMKQKMLEFIDQYHQPEGLITVTVSPSTLFLCTDDFLVWAGEQVLIYNTGMQIHVAEIRSELEDQLVETGHTPVQHLEALGLLNENLSAVHVVHVAHQDIELLAKHQTRVVHCPKSNMKLADGVAPIAQFLDKDIIVGLGTDGCASNDLLDMWEEMRVALLLARVHENNPDVLNPGDVFRMATVAGADIARLDVGVIEVGKLADLAVIDLNSVHLRPRNSVDLLNLLIFCCKAGDVRDTIINGEVIMENRRLLKVDEAALLAEAEDLSKELLNQFN